MQVCNWGVILSPDHHVSIYLIVRVLRGCTVRSMHRGNRTVTAMALSSGPRPIRTGIWAEAYWQSKRHIGRARGILTEAYETEAPRDPSVPEPPHVQYCAAEGAPQTMVRLCSRCCCCTAFPPERTETRKSPVPSFFSLSPFLPCPELALP